MLLRMLWFQICVKEQFLHFQGRLKIQFAFKLVRRQRLLYRELQGASGSFRLCQSSILPRIIYQVLESLLPGRFRFWSLGDHGSNSSSLLNMCPE